MPDRPQRLSDPAQLGVVLRQRRKELGLTQIDAAALSNVSPRLLGELERGRASVGLGLVLRVAATLGLDLSLVPRGGAG
jgi:HTH-type transcriptional regulator/antitoxin HipB